VENIIDAELGYIFTNDSEYLTSKASLVPKQEKPDPAEPAEPAKAGTATKGNLAQPQP